MDNPEEIHAQPRYALALFCFTAVLCGLLVAAAKSGTMRTNTAGTVDNAVQSANAVYQSTQTAPPLLSAQVTALQGQVQSMHEDLASMHFEFVHLQETLDLMVNEIMGDLKEENEDLRDEVNRMYVRLGQSRMDPTTMPEPAPVAPVPIPENASTEALFSDGEFGFIIVDEWGRSPEDAARLGNNVSTLKGMIGLVPPNSTSNDLQQLGIDLRMQYADYNNINIEIFDNKEAAESYGKRQVANPTHRVLSISKHANSGRDVILLVQNGMTTEIPF